MQREKHVIVLTCDLCKEEVEQLAKAGCSHKLQEVITGMGIELFCSGHRRVDLCSECSRKLMELLRKEFPKFSPWNCDLAK